jgi:hypothetical protein
LFVAWTGALPWSGRRREDSDGSAGGFGRTRTDMLERLLEPFARALGVQIETESPPAEFRTDHGMPDVTSVRGPRDAIASTCDKLNAIASTSIDVGQKHVKGHYEQAYDTRRVSGFAVATAHAAWRGRRVTRCNPGRGKPGALLVDGRRGVGQIQSTDSESKRAANTPTDRRTGRCRPSFRPYSPSKSEAARWGHHSIGSGRIHARSGPHGADGHGGSGISCIKRSGFRTAPGSVGDIPTLICF